MKKLLIIITTMAIVGGFIWLRMTGRDQKGQSERSMQQQPKLANVKKAKVARGNLAPEAKFTTINGQKLTLSDFENQKVMLWMFATWCQSCKVGAQVLQENNEKLQGMKIIGVKTYGNAGYSGQTVREFVKNVSPKLLSSENWIWGDFSQESTSIYNPQNYPDIYFLIDAKGVVRDIDGAPAATIGKIIQFANE